jgi:hypothetical protein
MKHAIFLQLDGNYRSVPNKRTLFVVHQLYGLNIWFLIKWPVTPILLLRDPFTMKSFLK